jgi:hypothetical protein
MVGFPIDPVVEAAMDFAEKIAKSQAGKGEDLVDLFATFAGMVAQEDNEIGLRCLEIANQWFCSGQIIR